MFRDQFHEDSVRLKGWDYSTPGFYFVTVCTAAMRNWFGAVVNDRMILNEMGQVCRRCWSAIPCHMAGYRLDEFVVMPNYLHGIIEILGEINVETLHATSLLSGNRRSEIMSDRAPRRGSLSVAVRSFKSAVTRQACCIDPAFAWQRRCYDHVIRNDESFQKIREYIYYNPLKWAAGRENEC